MKEFLRIVNINNFLSKNFKSQLAKERFFLILLITALVAIWFRKGLILGSGESGLPFYNTSRLFEILKSSWADVPIGGNGSIAFPSYPLYGIVAFFQQLNVPSYILQGGLFWLIFVAGVLSVHKIASLIKENSPLSRLSSALFYIFNPIAHISVLHRFQYPLIFFYGFMPLAFLIYFKGLKSKNFIYLVVLSLASLIFSFTFVGPAFLELFFGILGFLSIFVFVSTFKKEKDYFPLFYFLVFAVIFILVNCWWLSPLFASVFVDLGSRGSGKSFNPSDNIATFKGISDQIESVLGVFRLFKPNDYLKDNTSWVWIYGTTPFILLSFFSIIAFIVGLFKREKELLYKFLILVALIVMFWMKGTLAPFGGVTLRIFEWFTFLHVFRNPFEKIGLLLPFAMAIPVGFGIVGIVNALSSKLRFSKKLMAFLILTLAFPVFMFPTVTGLVFTGGGPPANDINIGQYVKVPDYYKDAREWLDKQPGVFRVLVLPIDGEGMTYKWEYGFAGVELSNNLFDQPMISLNTSNGSLPELVDNIKQTLLDYPDKLWNLAQQLNVKYIMVRDDIDYLARDTEAPATDLAKLKEYAAEHFSQVAEFGKLKFFELNPAQFTPKVFARTKLVYLSNSIGKGLNLMPFSNSLGDEIFIVPPESPVGNILENPYLAFADKIIINGTKIEDIKINLNKLIENLPFVSIYRDTPFYALVRLREELENQLQTPDTKMGFRVNLLGKRLAEINHSPEDVSAVNEYYQGIQSIATELISSKSIDRAIVEVLINQSEALEVIKKKTKDSKIIDQIVSDLDSLLIAIRAKSVYPTDKDLIHRFYVPKDSQYEVLITKSKWSYYFENIGISELNLDGNVIKLDILKQKDDGYSFSLGTYQLNKGIHEVSITQPKAKNLITEKLPEELDLSSEDQKPITKIIPIGQLDNNFSYSISFEYLEEKGNIPVIAIHSDVDFIDTKGEKIPRFGIALTRDNYDFGWKKYNATFTPFPASGENYISIKIIPFGDCKGVVQRPYRRYCEDNSFNQRFLKDSSTKIRNLKVEKQFLNQVILREVEADSIKKIPPKIDFEMISPARYKVRVSNAQNPFFLVLSTSFDPKWSAYFTTSDGRSDQMPTKNHLEVNGYSNGWYIEKTGNFEMFLEYSPERVLAIGRKLSFAFIIISILILVGYFTRMQINLKNRSKGL